MSYYDTIEEDLTRAKDLLRRGRPERIYGFTPEGLSDISHIAGGTIYGADIFAAYKLLESFVSEIERLRTRIQELEEENGLLVLVAEGDMPKPRHATSPPSSSSSSKPDQS